MPRLPERPSFQQYQDAFTAHIRDPKANPRPAGTPMRRMKVYNELLFNNLESFLLACFPVLRQVLGVRRWRRLVRAFFAEHRCHTPIFRQIPDEFVHYLQQTYQDRQGDPPFLRELAHYEWIELALSVDEREPDLTAFDPDGDLLNKCPALNPVMEQLAYSFPVHRIGPRFKPLAPDTLPTLIAVFRAADGKMGFMLLNPASFRLLEILDQEKCTGRQALEQVTVELHHPDPAQVIAGGMEMLISLQREGLILGTWRQKN